jgi:hypothetical protein
MNFVSMLNNIEEHLITSHFAFCTNIQLQGYRQYRIHGSVVNVLANLNLVQNVLLCMAYDDLSIVMLIKKEIGIYIYIW